MYVAGPRFGVVVCGVALPPLEVVGDVSCDCGGQVVSGEFVYERVYVD